MMSVYMYVLDAPPTLPKEYRIGWSGPPRRKVETLQEGER
jgi:hypothetical protein